MIRSVQTACISSNTLAFLGDLPQWADRLSSKQKWKAGQSAARGGKEAERLRKTEITTWGLTKAKVMGFFFPLRVNLASPWGSGLDAPLPPFSTPTTGWLWRDVGPHVGRWEMGASGGGLCEPVHLCPLLPPPTQATHHLQCTVPACWSRRAPAGRGRADQPSTLLNNLFIRVAGAEQISPHNVFPWRSNLHPKISCCVVGAGENDLSLLWVTQDGSQTGNTCFKVAIRNLWSSYSSTKVPDKRFTRYKKRITLCNEGTLTNYS